MSDVGRPKDFQTPKLFIPPENGLFFFLCMPHMSIFLASFTPMTALHYPFTRSVPSQG
jgi:hypothetical protein